ncbi:hypothetical protein V8F20_006911 [Naviculisporaceae sp. PSN 640]
MLSYIYLTFFLYYSAWADGQVFRWDQPAQLNSLEKRQIGYNPEYKSCGVGHDCTSCGDTFEECPAPIDVAVFCYEPGKGQKCCPNGQGKACDAGFYCAMDEQRHTWCCPEGLDLQQCAALHTVPALESAITATVSPTTFVSVTVTVTIDKTISITSMPPTSITKHPNATASVSNSIFVAGAERTVQRGFSVAVFILALSLLGIPGFLGLN